MPSPYITPTGLQIPTIEDLQEDLSTEQKAEIDPLLDTEPESPLGNLNGIYSSHLREAYETIEVVFNQTNPDAAEGFLLEGVSAISGTRRDKATKSKFAGGRKISVNLNAGTTLPVGSVASQAGNSDVRFVTTENAKNTGGAPANILVAAECEVSGPIVCNAGTLTVIATPVAGWNAVTNPYDAELGKNQASDAELRTQRENELRASGSATVDAMRADVLAIEIDAANPVIECTVFENDTDSTDANGLPPHSLEVLVFDGLSAAVPDNTIAQTIWDCKPGGIKLVGSSTGSAVDSQKRERIIPFTRPTQLPIKIKMIFEMTIDGLSIYAGDTFTKQQIADKFLATVRSGSLIRCNDYVCVAVEVPGIRDTISVQIAPVGSAYPASHVNYLLLARQIGTLETANIELVTNLI